MHNRMTAAAVACLAALALAACSDTADEDAVATTPSMSAEKTQPATGNSPGEVGEGDVVLDEGTVRAKAASDAPDGSDMTAIFGTLVNHSDKDITITGFSTSLNAKVNQMHETVDGKMQEMSSPLVVKAGESHELAPGGDHFMLMEMENHIAPGESLDLKVELEGGEELDLGEIQTRSMPAGDEDYGDMAGHGMEGHNH